MAKNKEMKTNAMRILDRMDIVYESFFYQCPEFTNALQVADMLRLPYEEVYKTLVAVGGGGDYFVFVIPIAGELNLKKAAKAVGEKSLSMIHVKEIQAVTGYVRGGCTAIGMKRQYATTIDGSAASHGTIVVSGGRIGTQIRLSPLDLCRAVQGKFAELVD